MTERAESFGDTLIRLSASEPDRSALTFQDQSLTRAELMNRASSVADRFRALGVAADDTVVACLPNSVALVEITIATWLVGATPLPVSPRLAPVERDAIITLARPALVVADVDLSHVDTRVVTVEEVSALGGTDAGAPQAPPELSSAWKALASGGSTGAPKLIVTDSPALSSAIIATGEAIGVEPDGCLLVAGPLSHNMSFFSLAMGLLNGKHVVLLPRFSAGETLRLIAKHQVDWVSLVPTMMLRIWRLGPDRAGYDVSCLRVVFHTGASCPPWLKECWITWLGADKIVEIYGGTELQAMTLVRGPEWLSHPGTVGRPALGELDCRDDAGRRCRPGQIGELWMRRGLGVPAPYRYVGGQARASTDGWESLGDMGYFDADGFLYIADRRTDMIVIGGVNVYPAEIEAAIDAHPHVRSSCVIGLPHEDLGNVAHAIVELASPVTDEALLAFLRDRLAPYKLPRSIECSETPLRDDAGKVRRSALRAARLAKTMS